MEVKDDFVDSRRCDSVKLVLIITSDKCYENREVERAYLETDRLGGKDPYSSSKACAELVTAAYRSSFSDCPKVASLRAGNIIGGGTGRRTGWSPTRCARSRHHGRS